MAPWRSSLPTVTGAPGSVRGLLKATHTCHLGIRAHPTHARCCRRGIAVTSIRLWVALLQPSRGPTQALRARCALQLPGDQPPLLEFLALLRLSHQKALDVLLALDLWRRHVGRHSRRRRHGFHDLLCRTLIGVPAVRAAPVPVPPGVRTSFGSSTWGCRGLGLRDALFELLEHLAAPVLHHQVADLAIAAEACGPQRGDLALQRGDPLQVPLELLLEQIEALADLADAADLSSR